MAPHGGGERQRAKTMSASEAQNKAEEELLNLVGGVDVQRFVVAIYRHADRWVVEATDRSSGLSRVGEGSSFAEAWLQQEPKYAYGSVANDHGSDGLDRPRQSF
ncbi:hypothetical protein [Beijerinckia sp. L45]|uniref:hypothetical protein n=1 Tax=Beijerinckia sp. L45 TaxID=1641855 RepID=UPI00131B547B|nr:hypothetical protein [Beijerinckia sp. L45]